MLLHVLILLAIIVTVLVAAHVFLNPPAESPPAVPRRATSLEEACQHLREGGWVFLAPLTRVHSVQAMAANWVEHHRSVWLLEPGTIPAPDHQSCAAWIDSGKQVWLRWGPGEYRRTLACASDFLTDDVDFVPFNYFLVNREA